MSDQEVPITPRALVGSPGSDLIAEISDRDAGISIRFWKPWREKRTAAQRKSVLSVTGMLAPRHDVKVLQDLKRFPARFVSVASQVETLVIQVLARSALSW